MRGGGREDQNALGLRPFDDFTDAGIVADEIFLKTFYGGRQNQAIVMYEENLNQNKRGTQIRRPFWT